MKAAQHDWAGRLDEVEDAIGEPVEKEPSDLTVHTRRTLWKLNDLRDAIRKGRNELLAERRIPLPVPTRGLAHVLLRRGYEPDDHSDSNRRDRTVSQGSAASGFS